MFNNNCFIKASTLRLRFRSITNKARGSAGGGAGGGASLFFGTDGGGGGAGGYRTSMPEGPGGPSPTAESQITISGPFPSPYSVTIGAGGAGGILSGFGGNGSPSSFGPTTSQGGGGGGGSVSPYGGVNGGSGGGTGDSYSGGTKGLGNKETGSPTPAPNQGYDGTINGAGPVAGGGAGAGADGAG